jgi:hypothetical protein
VSSLDGCERSCENEGDIDELHFDSLVLIEYLLKCERRIGKVLLD